MTASKRLAAYRSAATSAPVTDDEELPVPGETDTEEEEDPENPPATEAKDENMTEITQAAVDAAREDSRKAGFEAGQKAERERSAAVFASEHYTGREATAIKLLGRDMSAQDIIDVLGDMPKAEPTAKLTEEEQRKAAEEGGRKEIKEQIGKTGNSAIDPGTGEGGKDGDDNAPKAKAARILANQRAFTGQKPKANAD